MAGTMERDRHLSLLSKLCFLLVLNVINLEFVYSIHKNEEFIIAENQTYLSSVTLKKMNDNITSPNYPESFDKLQHIDCLWTISIKSHQHHERDEKVSVSFVDFDLPGPSEYSRCIHSYVEYGSLTENNARLSTSGRLCGVSLPEEHTFTGVSAVWVSFVHHSTKRVHSHYHFHRGFLLTYHADVIEQDHTQNQIIIAITITALVVFGCCFPACVYFRKKQITSVKQTKKKLRRQRATRRVVKDEKEMLNSNGDKNNNQPEIEVVQMEGSVGEGQVNYGSTGQEDDYEEIPANQILQQDPTYVTAEELNELSQQNLTVHEMGTPYVDMDSSQGETDKNVIKEDLYLSVKPSTAEAIQTRRRGRFSVESITSMLRCITPRIRLPFSGRRRNKTSQIGIEEDTNKMANMLSNPSTNITDCPPVNNRINNIPTPQITINFANSKDCVFFGADFESGHACGTIDNHSLRPAPNPVVALPRCASENRLAIPHILDMSQKHPSGSHSLSISSYQSTDSTLRSRRFSLSDTISGGNSLLKHVLNKRTVERAVSHRKSCEQKFMSSESDLEMAAKTAITSSPQLFDEQSIVDSCFTSESEPSDVSSSCHGHTDKDQLKDYQNFYTDNRVIEIESEDEPKCKKLKLTSVNNIDVSLESSAVILSNQSAGSETEC